jgi:hypothetical protein
MYGTQNPTLLAVAGVQSHHVFITKEAKMTKKLSKTAQMSAFIRANPTVSSGVIAEKFGVKSGYVSSLKWKLKKEGVQIPETRKVLGVTMGIDDYEKLTDEQLLRVVDGYKKPKMRMLGVYSSNESVLKQIEPAADPVNHPAHYKAGGIETIDFIEAKKLNYNLGNVVKYIARSELKGNRTQDLEKALWYLKREIGA